MATHSSETVGNSDPEKSTHDSSTPVHIAKPKFADHPHWWTIILGIVALVVSGLSYQESHRSRLVNEGVNRPLVRLISIQPSGPVLGRAETEGETQINSYTVQIRNSGKSFATGIKITYRAQLQDTRVGNQFRRFSDAKDAATGTQLVGDLAPEDEFTWEVWAHVLKNNPTVHFGDHDINMVSLIMKGQVDYKNPVNNASYTDSFCFIDAGTYGKFRRFSAEDANTK